MNIAQPLSEDFILRRPLEPGAPISYWQLGNSFESRYDVADQPMQGEMDPFFFLTKHKNFIPHQYPCRTEFIAERRDERPVPKGEFAPARLWLPFGSPRVDLSGFWFRPTTIGTWGRTVLSAVTAGPAKLRLRTCGGAVLFVNDREIGWMAPYGRNLEAEQVFNIALDAGGNEIRIWFDDLAERDARYFFQLDYITGPTLTHALPIDIEGSTAERMEAMLGSMHFDKPSYSSGPVVLVSDVSLPVDIDVSIKIEGDFMSIEKSVIVERKLVAGSHRLEIADTEALPADFRHFHVSLKASGFVISRVFGVEICHATRQGTPPANLAERIKEALDEVSNHAEADSVRALARLATGRGGLETEAMILASLPAIEDCHDCADFILVPLLWCRHSYAGSLSPSLVERIDAAIVNYRYWMDEPGNDVQWYFSENHALLFHTAAYIAGHILPQSRFVRSGRAGVEQSATGLARIRAWLDHFEAWEMAEFNSAPYFPIDLKGLTILMALAPDADIRARATKAINRLLEIVARSAHHGILTGAQGRSYEHTLRAGRSLELSGMARMLWGCGYYGQRFHTLPQLALCLRDHGLIVPEALRQIALFNEEGAQEWCFAQGEGRIAKLYHYKTHDYAMGTAAAYRWNEWGYQETVLHLRLGTHPDAQIWINHPGETIHSGYGRPSFWGGSGTLPRVHQYRALSIAVFDCALEQPGFTHAWFPQSAFDRSSIAAHVALAQSGSGLVLLKSSGVLSLVKAGPTAGNELRVEGHKAIWIVRLGDTQSHADLSQFGSRFDGVEVEALSQGGLLVSDPDYGEVRFFVDGRVEAEGRRLNPSDWTIGGKAEMLPAGKIIGGKHQDLPIQFDGH